MLRSSALPPIDSPSRGFAKFTIHERSTPEMIPSLLGLPSGACVISANKYIGFGRTGTQEEMHVGSTPEACPAVLITQPLADGEVMVVRGAESMIEMEGYGREAKLGAVLKKSSWDWRARTMLFMDALELDSFETEAGLSVPDLFPGNVDRELMKAYTAFSSYQPLIAVNPSAARYTEVVTGLWGCRAFGGNKEIKTVIQWCAASLAGVPLAFVCEAKEVEFLANLRVFVDQAEKGKWTVSDVFDLLRAVLPEGEEAKSCLSYIVRRLDSPAED